MKSIMSGVVVAALLCGSTAYARPDGHGNGNHGNPGQGNGPGNWSQHDNRGPGNDNGRHRGWGQDRGDQHRWNRGERMGYNDWRNAPRVDYRQYHLRKPPRGYEWRQRNDQFILVAVTTGLIASIILGAGR